MTSEVFQSMLSAGTQPNTSGLIGQGVKVQMGNDTKHTAKKNLRQKKWNVSQCYANFPTVGSIKVFFFPSSMAKSII